MFSVLFDEIYSYYVTESLLRTKASPSEKWKTPLRRKLLSAFLFSDLNLLKTQIIALTTTKPNRNPNSNSKLNS